MEGEEIEGGHPGQVRRFMGSFWKVRRLRGVIPGGRRPPIGAEGPQLAKRACPPRRGLEGEPRSGSNF